MLDTLIVVWLWFTFPVKASLNDFYEELFDGCNLLSSSTPESLARSRSVCWRNTMIVGSGPEPTVDIYGRQVLSIAAFVLEIAFSSTGVDWGYIIYKQKSIQYQSFHVSRMYKFFQALSVKCFKAPKLWLTTLKIFGSTPTGCMSACLCFMLFLHECVHFVSCRCI